MTPHILTHNAYIITSLLNLTIGHIYISSHLYNRWLKNYGITLIDTNIINKLLLVFYGFFIISWQDLFSKSINHMAFIIPTALIIGLILPKIEIGILRFFTSYKYNITNSTSTLFDIKQSHDNFYIDYNSKLFYSSYTAIALAACLEEILYRGFLTLVCLYFIPSPYIQFSLMTITLLFSLNHLSLGILHVFSKFTLGLVCLAAFLFTKSIISSILIHLTFNLIAIHQIKKLTYA
jgi:membrane protease YdiL (CAAX protease family)